MQGRVVSEPTFRGLGREGSFLCPYARASLGLHDFPGSCGHEFYMRVRTPWRGLQLGSGPGGRVGVAATGRPGDFFLQEEPPGTIYAVPLVPLTAAEYHAQSQEVLESLCNIDFDPLRECRVAPDETRPVQAKLRAYAIRRWAASLQLSLRRLKRFEELAAPAKIIDSERTKAEETTETLRYLGWDFQVTPAIEAETVALQAEIDRLREAEDSEDDA